MPRLIVSHDDRTIGDPRSVYLGPWCVRQHQKSNTNEENKHVLNRALISSEERFKRNNFADDVIEKLLPDIAAH
jgi:hypothetical protein